MISPGTYPWQHRSAPSQIASWDSQWGGMIFSVTVGSKVATHRGAFWLEVLVVFFVCFLGGMGLNESKPQVCTLVKIQLKPLNRATSGW